MPLLVAIAFAIEPYQNIIILYHREWIMNFQFGVKSIIF